MNPLKRLAAKLYHENQRTLTPDAKTERHQRPEDVQPDGYDKPRDYPTQRAPSGPTKTRPKPSARPGQLASSPSIGRISGAWQRHLADEDWPRPSLVADYGLIGPMIVAAASVVGRGHSHRHLQRQDAYGFKLLDDTLVCAVADGVSSAPFSGPAADIAISAALTAASTTKASQKRPVERLEFASWVASDAVAAFARKLFPHDAHASDHCATTLILCATCIENHRGDMRATIVSIGDSSVLELTRDEQINIISGSPPATRPQPLQDYVPRPEAAIATSECLVPAGSILLLTTDGLARDLHESPAVRNWVVAGLRDSANTVDAAHVLSYTRHGSSDDLTFVAIRPHLGE